MFFPRKMKFIELTVLKDDMDTVLKFLGKRGAIHFPDSQKSGSSPVVVRIRQIIDRLYAAAKFIGVELKSLNIEDENISVPNEADTALTDKICSIIEDIKESQTKTEQERQHVRETLNEARAFSSLKVPFSELEQLSYIALRIGRLDPDGQTELRESLGDRAVIVPLGSENRILAASSRKGRFNLDSQLKKVSFEPISIPHDHNGIPSELLVNLEERFAYLNEEIKKIDSEKEKLRLEKEAEIKYLFSSWNIALIIEELKTGFTVTESVYHFSGWTPADMASEITKGLFDLTGGRVAIKAYSPEEIPSVQDGSEKVPVYIKHGAFVKGFKGVVFSFGAPLYGTVDPTPIVAFFFTLLFGIMFGDVGQGFVLFLAGFLIRKIPKLLAKFNSYSIPLISIGISSMFFGLLFGAFFTNERMFIAPTRAITSAITGQPVDRILAIMPIAELGGSLTKLLYFFGFTIVIGVIIISIGIIINIVNRRVLKEYEAVFFSKTGLAGLLFFWYALFIAVRMILGGRFAWFDLAGLLIPVVCIVFGPVIWRVITGEKPILEHGFMAFFMEGFVEILETFSGYISNTASFLRVGAFALSHTVLSFIVFTFYDMLVNPGGILGPISAVFILLVGNTIIIVLEGMIVAIQVVRLQYYEFFNKFFVETGVEFSPFRFKIKNVN